MEWIFRKDGGTQNYLSCPYQRGELAPQCVVMCLEDAYDFQQQSLGVSSLQHPPTAYA